MKEPELAVHCTVECSDPDWCVDEEALRDLVDRVCLSLGTEIRGIAGVRRAVFLTCYFVAASEMHDLNRFHRGTDAVTDILSFPLGFSAPGKGWVLGDIVVCMNAVLNKAESSGNALEDQLAFSLIHSLLHLIGYDHMIVADRARMEDREEAVFSAVGSFIPQRLIWRAS